MERRLWTDWQDLKYFSSHITGQRLVRRGGHVGTVELQHIGSRLCRSVTMSPQPDHVSLSQDVPAAAVRPG